MSHSRGVHLCEWKKSGGCENVEREEMRDWNFKRQMEREDKNRDETIECEMRGSC